MLNYLQDYNLSISYLNWMVWAYPLVLFQIPIVSWLLFKSFTPEYKILDSGVRKLVIQVAKSDAMTGRNTIAVVIFFLIFLGWIFFSESVGLGTIALTGVLLYLVGGFIRWEDLNRNTHWGVILLFGSTISLGSNIKDTGAAEWLASQLIQGGGSVMEMFPFIADTIVVMITVLLANVLSSSATVAVLGPITMNLTADTIHMGMVTAIASAFGYFTAVAAPACTIIYSSGMVNAKDFLKIGWKVGVVSIVLLVLYANTYWLIIN
jgi:sodium-dependent dicarboxylate transporter 2/3/5